jgi:hypothetical protein
MHCRLFKRLVSITSVACVLGMSLDDAIFHPVRTSHTFEVNKGYIPLPYHMSSWAANPDLRLSDMQISQTPGSPRHAHNPHSGSVTFFVSARLPASLPAGSQPSPVLSCIYWISGRFSGPHAPSVGKAVVMLSVVICP